MKFQYWLIYSLLYMLSLLPLTVLHGVSNFFNFLLYRIFKYRVKVVRENIAFAFPEKSITERMDIEKQFYVNFCDLILETVKGFSIGVGKFEERCHFKSQTLAQNLFDQKVNILILTGHLANWEWLGISIPLNFKQPCFTVYKPLNNPSFDFMMQHSRKRFGLKLVSSRMIRDVLPGGKSFDQATPFMLAMIADQAPHQYERSFEIKFLGQKSFFFHGPGVIAVQSGLTPVWLSAKRVGRSKIEWGIEKLEGKIPAAGWSDEDLAQIERIANQHQITREQSERALAITQDFARALEENIRAAPADWLWSHRRWKKR